MLATPPPTHLVHLRLIGPRPIPSNVTPSPPPDLASDSPAQLCTQPSIITVHQREPGPLPIGDHCIHTHMYCSLTIRRSTAGHATQGISGARVHAAPSAGRQKKSKRARKAAYVVFCGRRPGVFRTWCVPHIAPALPFELSFAQVRNGEARRRCPQLHFPRLHHCCRSGGRLRLRLRPLLDTAY
jgi:hypothetical protein